MFALTVAVVLETGWPDGRGDPSVGHLLGVREETVEAVVGRNRRGGILEA